MGKKDLFDLEDEILSTVSNALKAIDFVNLKKDINNKAEGTLNQFKAKINEYGDKYVVSNKKARNDISAYISKKPAGKVSGVLCIVFGASGALIYGILTISSLIFKSLFGSINSFSTIIFMILLICFVASLSLLFKGINLRKRVNRFRKYVRVIDSNSYILIKDLARFARSKESFIVKDLNKMINLGMFLEGHVDEEKIYFMLSDEVYGNYLKLKEQEKINEINKRKLSEDLKKQVKKESKKTDDLENKEVTDVIVKGKDYIKQIRVVMNDLSREKIYIKLDKLQRTAIEIFNHVEKNLDKTNEVNRLVNHYLPITIKLITSYRDLNSKLTQGENIRNAKMEIEKSIDLINDAFENLLDNLFHDVVLDISTDISVLRTLFKQEGLTDKDFE